MEKNFVRETVILFARSARSTSCNSCQHGPKGENSGGLSDCLSINKNCWSCNRINNEVCEQCGAILVDDGECPNSPGILYGVHGRDIPSVILNFKAKAPHLNPIEKPWVECDAHKTVVLSKVEGNGRVYPDFAMGCLTSQISKYKKNGCGKSWPDSHEYSDITCPACHFTDQCWNCSVKCTDDSTGEGNFKCRSCGYESKYPIDIKADRRRLEDRIRKDHGALSRALKAVFC